MLSKDGIKSNNTLITNVGWSFLSKIFAMLLFFLADAVYARILGVENYAEWAYFFSLCNMAFYIGWLGVNLSSKVFISKTEDWSQCLGAALQIRFLVSIAVAALVLLCASKIAIIAGYPRPYENLNILLYILSGMVFFNSFTDFFKQIYVGTQAYKKLCFITFVEYFSYGFFSLLGLKLYNNPISIAAGYCVGGGVLLICNAFIIYREYDIKKIYEGRKNKKLQKDIVKYAVPLVLTSIGGLILTEMDTVMLGLLSTKEQVSLYSIVKTLVSQSVNVNMAIWTGTVVSLSVITKDNFIEKSTKFKNVCKINSTVSIFICSCFVVVGKSMICLVYGDKFSAVQEMIIGLMPYQFLYCISSLRAAFLDFMGHARGRAFWYTSVIIINLVLNYVFIPVYGAIGASVASSFSLVPYTFYCIYDTRKVFRNLKIKFADELILSEEK